jgi:DNA-binding helix-turn-helix protein
MEYVKYDSEQRKELQKNLERLRLRYNLSKQELADDLGWSRNTIDYWIRGDRVPDKTGIEAICDYFGIDDVELLGSEMKVRTFAYYKNDSLIAFGTMDEIAEQTGRKIESLRSLLCNSKRFNKTTKTYMIELEDDRRYKLKFKQSFTVDELNLKGIGWLLKSPLVEVEEVEA